MQSKFTDSRLEAYLDEALVDAEMGAIEQAARSDPAVAGRLAEIARQRDAGIHSLAAIWRRHRVNCPQRARLGSYLLGILPAEEAECIRLHIEVVACPYCRANLDDLQRERADSGEGRRGQRQSIFDSSSGLLGRGYKPDA